MGDDRGVEFLRQLERLLQISDIRLNRAGSGPFQPQ
jgi:hypothetical protein